jgi:hypothetical protein
MKYKKDIRLTVGKKKKVFVEGPREMGCHPAQFLKTPNPHPTQINP